MSLQVTGTALCVSMGLIPKPTSLSMYKMFESSQAGLVWLRLHAQRTPPFSSSHVY